MSHAARPVLPPRTQVPEDHGVLVLYCHPNPHRSRANRALIDAITGLEGVTIHELYEHYPDHAIDVPHEQALLAAHHTIVMQHPLYWYSTPPLLKEWMDLVLDFGWAYGPGGTALEGKRMLNAVTTGGPEAAYQHDGMHRHTLREFLAPLEQTARLCRMTWLEPFAVHGVHGLDTDGLIAGARAYRDLIVSLRESE